MGRLRFGVAFAVRDIRDWIPAFAGMTKKKSGNDEVKEWNRGFPGGGRKRRRGTSGKVVKVNYPVQGTPGSLINL